MAARLSVMSGREHILHMGPRQWIYYIKEAFSSIFRNGWMSIASIGVVAVTLFILGSFMLLSKNVDYLANEVKDELEIVAYVDETLSVDEVDDLRVKVIQMSNIEEVRYVSKKDALERLREKMGEMVDGFGDEGRINPLRDSFEIRTIVPEDIPSVAAALQELPGIARVDYGTEIVEKLFKFTGVVKWVGMAFMTGLALTAAFLIANTIKLTVNVRSNEIMIMKYVGATEWFIRWPFLIEGILLGSLGAVIPALFLTYFYGQMVLWADFNLNFLPLVPTEFIIFEINRILIILGVTIGCFGSLVSMRRFLKV